MAAIKNSILIKEKHPDTKVTIFYIDIRTYGKGYEEYYNRAVALGVRFIRGLPSEVTIEKDTLTLVNENTENGEMLTLHPDLIVLSAGIEPSSTTSGIAKMLGLDTDANGFIAVKNEALDPVATTIPGIYVAGTATAPKDIPDTVSYAGAAAMRAVHDSREAI